jgi:predicted TIM-barrel fold metal-dependent hydrolase
LAATVPIIDLHMHLNGGNLSTLVQLLDEVGVLRAGSGGADSGVASSFAAQAPDRLVPFAGEGEVRRAIRADGAHAWNLESPAIVDYLDQLEVDLQAGRFEGIGLLFPNNQVGGGAGLEPRSPADSPLMQRLWALSAQYQVPMSVAMNATDDSVAEMERLLASDRRGTWLWAGTGTFADPPLLRRLLQAHPNLYCDLSGRMPLFRGKNGPPFDLIPIMDVVNIADANERLRPEWKALLAEFPDRFVIGTDSPPVDFFYRTAIDVWRHILEDLPPDIATKLAYGNAERLLRP